MPFMLTIRVIPAAGRSKAVLNSAGNLKIYLVSPAQDGKANKELIELLSKKLNIAKSAITITSGLTSRTKRLSIAAPVTWNDILVAFDIPAQLSIVSNN